MLIGWVAELQSHDKATLKWHFFKANGEEAADRLYFSIFAFEKKSA